MKKQALYSSTGKLATASFPPCGNWHAGMQDVIGYLIAGVD
jgi:hypothetical protein